MRCGPRVRSKTPAHTRFARCGAQGTPQGYRRAPPHKENYCNDYQFIGFSQFPLPPNKIQIKIKNGSGGSGRLLGATGVILPHIPFRKVVWFFSEFNEMLLFSGFSFCFDFMCTFQLQWLSWTCLWYVIVFDLYPKCPQCSDLSRNVSIFVVRVRFCGQIILA